ncbi:MAG: ergothioneine biosynthesis protein EgtB [Acidobacteria bacterium]|nr:ergothioneine biosynthesis protein EgtB [Acidobacteriota bacterium]
METEKPLLTRYREIRAATENLAEPLEVEDCVIQSMPDVSPTRWHLAHTTWFFETFVLSQAFPDYEAVHPLYKYLFNSYYNAVGEQFPRPRRGLLSRPTVAEVMDYRRRVDDRMEAFLQKGGEAVRALAYIIELGINHEQQHQELILTDIKHVLSCNPLYPAYGPSGERKGEALPQQWKHYPEAIYRFGYQGKEFCFDNELPSHRVLVGSFELATRLVTCGEYMKFIEDNGYRRPEFWLSAGWQQVLAARWQAPLYWIKKDQDWWQFTLSGLRPVEQDEPVCHVSYFEADAYARWAGARLPTEFEWELAAAGIPIEGNFVETGLLHPAATTRSDTPAQMFGDVWEWTSSAYAGYPGFAPAQDALGEYNGKFMCNQYVLRGGSCVTPSSHIRPTYRNFFQPEAQWQFSGIRLCR